MDEVFIGCLDGSVGVLVVVLQIVRRLVAGSRVLTQPDRSLGGRNVILVQLYPNRVASTCVLNFVRRCVSIHYFYWVSEAEISLLQLKSRD